MVNFNFFITPIFAFDNWSQLLEVTLPRLTQPLKCVVEFFAGGIEARSQNQLLPLFFFQARKDFVEGGIFRSIFLIPSIPKFIKLTIISMLK